MQAARAATASPSSHQRIRTRLRAQHQTPHSPRRRRCLRSRRSAKTRPTRPPRLRRSRRRHCTRPRARPRRSHQCLRPRRSSESRPLILTKAAHSSRACASQTHRCLTTCASARSSVSAIACSSCRSSYTTSNSASPRRPRAGSKSQKHLLPRLSPRRTYPPAAEGRSRGRTRRRLIACCALKRSSSSLHRHRRLHRRRRCLLLPRRALPHSLPRLYLHPLLSRRPLRLLRLLPLRLRHPRLRLRPLLPLRWRPFQRQFARHRPSRPSRRPHPRQRGRRVMTGARAR